LRTDALLQLRAVRELKGKDPLFRLLEIFTLHGCRDYKQFVQEHNGFFASKGLDQDACLSKIRLLTLSGLCAEKSQLTFTEVAHALDIDESDVEMWVVDVVTQGLIDVRINQPQALITVRYTEQQVFNEKQWHQLQNRVAAVSRNIQDLIQVVQSLKTHVTA